MKKQLLVFTLLICTFSVFSQKKSANKWDAGKKQASASLDNHATDLIQISDNIWGYAETALLEIKSSVELANYAEKNGFTVERGVADMPSAFVASYGSGKPIIGILAEYDALPGLSQQATTDKNPLEVGKAGHGCGHNMFGAASLGAAISIKEMIESGKIKGTVRLYGTPAEEAVGGKLYMARAGLFDDLDACLDWHPSDEVIAGTQSSQAVIDYSISFKGKAAHAAYDPWNGRSALDAVESFLDGMNLLREHIKPSVRIHYVITNGGNVPNVVPEEAKVWLWIRDSKMEGVLEVSERMKDIAKGAALIAGVEYEVTLNNGIYELLVNRTGATALQKNLELLGEISYTPEELAFAKAIQENTGKPQIGMSGTVSPLRPTEKDPEGGSTDVGDVSWIVPEISLAVSTAPKGTPWHSWPVVACGGMSIGHKGMIYAGKALAMTMLDLYTTPSLLIEMKAEFKERKGSFKYVPMIPEGKPYRVDER